MTTRLPILLGLAALAIACASAPPARHVVERDIDGLAYRRYQQVLDVEFPVAGNEAVGHTATYVDRSTDEVRFATAFVSVYERPDALAAEVRDGLRSLGTYDVAVDRVEGEWVWRVSSGDETWIVWVSANRVVKLGAPPGEDIPEGLAETYLSLYPSDLGESGQAREGTASVGRSARAQAEAEEDLGLPGHLREGAPR